MREPRVIASSGCETNNCPTMYRTTSGDVAIQGYDVASPADVLPAGTTIPKGETVVLIPGDVMDDLVAQYLEQRALV